MMKIIFKAMLPLFASALVLGVSASSQALDSIQDPQSDSATSARQQDTQDPIAQLNLTPEQREKIRAIREQTKNERAAINQRVRQSNAALEQALDSDNPDEALVEQRLREVAASQAAATRMRVLTEVRIRRVLTPEQLGTLRVLRQQAGALRREQRLENRRPRRQGVDGVKPNQRNGLGPLFPRRGNATRVLTPKPRA